MAKRAATAISADHAAVQPASVGTKTSGAALDVEEATTHAAAAITRQEVIAALLPCRSAVEQEVQAIPSAARSG